MEPTGPDPELPDGDRAEDEPHTFEEWVRAGLQESMLWPAFVVVAGVVFTVGAGILLFALYVRNLAGIAALVILVLMSIDGIRQDVRARGFGWISRTIVAVWIGSGLAAWAALWVGLLELA